MDFFTVSEQSTKTGVVVKPQFIVKKSEDLMVRGKNFYAVWDEAAGLWSQDEYDVARLVDMELKASREKIGPMANVLWMRDFSSNSWKDFKSYLSNVPDNSKPLDSKITFKNTPIRRQDYASKRLPYSLEDGRMEAYEELVSTLYDPIERAKLEWAIGAIISGDSRRIQKFMVLYGPSGFGKSTILNIIQKLFEGYYTIFNATEITSNNSSFSTTPFKDNPLIGIEHDGNLANIKENGLLNSIVSHEEIVINEKFKSVFTARIQAFLFIGTNKPVKITDAKSGLLRRLIDVHPSGRLVPEARYGVLVSQVEFELGAIASHCLEVYRSMGANYYSEYRPIRMMFETNLFYNFVEYGYDVFRTQDYTTLAQAYDLYKIFCMESNIKEPMPRHAFRTELSNYFDEFLERATVPGGEQVRSVYKGFKVEKFQERPMTQTKSYSLVMDEDISLLDEMLANRPAQLARKLEDGREIPFQKWAEVQTTLSDLDTSEVHYVKLPENHIVIDFDLKDDSGAKSQELNIAEASLWPSTYAEFSKSGAGVHLHYIYNGDPSELSHIYSPGVEIKTFIGDASLRRRLSRCNNIPVAALTSGLPLKEKKVIDFDGVKSERALRSLLERNLRKEIHPGTKPSIDFIKKILDDAVESGLRFDVTDLRPRIMAFANNSTNQADYCIRLVSNMTFQSEGKAQEPAKEQYENEKIAFFDIEVFPNLLLISWKFQGDGSVVRMYNPTPEEVGQFLKLKLVGFNCRRYDNHILYARYLGYSNQQIYELSKKLISGSRNAMFAEAYDISYADIYDFASVKQSLKKWQVDLGIFHKEVNFPWDEPLPEEYWGEVGDYCDNDVISEEVVFEHRHQDFVARQVLAKLSGLSANSTTQQHTARIIFGKNRKPQAEFVYTDLSQMFPGYTFSFGKSSYMGEDPGEGGYVYAEPGMYENVAVLDVASMHPTSIEQLNLFGPYTKNFSDLKSARLAIKHGELDKAGKMLNGALKPYLGDDQDAKDLAYALKIVINTVYGLTSAKFENPFRDLRNVDNIVAKRGALFMIDLKHFVQGRGFKVIHIKTDSIKIPDATPEIIQEVMEFGAKYGYEFEHEETYQKMCLVNDAVYIAKTAEGEWKPTGAQFAVPYVYKTLFADIPITFDDLCITKQVTTAMYLDFDSDRPMHEYDKNSPQFKFIGKIGRFVPVKEGCGGGILLREKDDKFYAVGGTKGYFWLEADVAKERWDNQDDTIDDGYFAALVDDALNALRKYGNVSWFLE